MLCSSLYIYCMFPFSNVLNFHWFSLTLFLYFQSDNMLASMVYFLLTPRVFLCGRWHCFLTLGRSCHGAHSSGLWLLSLSPCFSIARYISPFISTRFASWGAVSPWPSQSLNRAPLCPIHKKHRLFTGQQTTNDCYLRFCFATHLQPKASSLCTINNSGNLVPTFSNFLVFNLGLYSTLELFSGIFVLFFSVGFFPLFMLYCELNEWNNIAACFLSVMLVLKERVNSSTVDCCGAVRAVHLSVSASEVVISNVILTWK